MDVSWIMTVYGASIPLLYTIWVVLELETITINLN